MDKYKDINYCRNEILEARKIMCDKNTTIDEMNNLIKAIAYIYLYCPKEFMMIAKSTLDEAQRRLQFLEFGF
jgi:hypothetical protein